MGKSKSTSGFTLLEATIAMAMAVATGLVVATISVNSFKSQHNVATASDFQGFSSDVNLVLGLGGSKCGSSLLSKPMPVPTPSVLPSPNPYAITFDPNKLPITIPILAINGNTIFSSDTPTNGWNYTLKITNILDASSAPSYLVQMQLNGQRSATTQELGSGNRAQNFNANITVTGGKISSCSLAGAATNSNAAPTLVQNFTTSQVWTVPPELIGTMAYVEVWGGGSAGLGVSDAGYLFYGNTNFGYTAVGGGSGAYSAGYIKLTQPSYPIVVGQGGFVPPTNPYPVPGAPTSTTQSLYGGDSYFGGTTAQTNTTLSGGRTGTQTTYSAQGALVHAGGGNIMASFPTTITTAGPGGQSINITSYATSALSSAAQNDPIGFLLGFYGGGGNPNFYNFLTYSWGPHNPASAFAQIQGIPGGLGIAGQTQINGTAGGFHLAGPSPSQFTYSGQPFPQPFVGTAASGGSAPMGGGAGGISSPGTCSNGSAPGGGGGAAQCVPSTISVPNGAGSSGTWGGCVYPAVQTGTNRYGIICTNFTIVNTCIAPTNPNAPTGCNGAPGLVRLHLAPTTNYTCPTGSSLSTNSAGGFVCNSVYSVAVSGCGGFSWNGPNCNGTFVSTTTTPTPTPTSPRRSGWGSQNSHPSTSVCKAGDEIQTCPGGAAPVVSGKITSCSNVNPLLSNSLIFSCVHSIPAVATSN